MCDAILAQRLYGGIRAEHGLHLPEHLFTLFDGLRIGFLFQQVIGLIDFLERVLIQLQVDDAAFIVYRASRTVLDSLRHVVDVDIIAKHLAGIAILYRYRRAGEADERRTGQGIVNDAGIAHHHAGFLFTGLVFAYDNALVKAILAAVCLVGYDHNVAPGG